MNERVYWIDGSYSNLNWSEAIFSLIYRWNNKQISFNIDSLMLRIFEKKKKNSSHFAQTHCIRFVCNLQRYCVYVEVNQSTQLKEMHINCVFTRSIQPSYILFNIWLWLLTRRTDQNMQHNMSSVVYLTANAFVAIHVGGLWILELNQMFVCITLPILRAQIVHR